MTPEEIKTKINAALSELYKRDKDLIANETEEETVSAHLVCYLKPHFDSWSVDPEYNRDGRATKKSSRGNRIFPDILIHNRTPNRKERYSPENNLVVVEVKGHWNKARKGREKDEDKLRNMRKRYGYQHLFRVELDKDVGKIIEVSI